MKRIRVNSLTDVTVNVTDNNIHIVDSYIYSEKDFQEILDTIDYYYCHNAVLINRSECSLKLEWAAHNFMYLLHISRARTKDVDLDWPQKWYVKVFYAVVGSIGWIFIE